MSKESSRTPPLNDMALQAYADEHLAYEVAMMRSSWRAERANGETLAGWTVNMALLEASVLHGRVLVNFLFPRRVGAEDVIAADYFTDPGDWSNRSPVLTPGMRRLRDRADKEVAHLTTRRIAGTPPGKEWSVDLFLELEDALAVFARNAPKISPWLRRLLLNADAPQSRPSTHPNIASLGVTLRGVPGPGTVVADLGYGTAASE